MVNVHYGREAEDRADAFSVDLLARAGIPPDSFARALERIKDAAHEGAGPAEVPRSAFSDRRADRSGPGSRRAASSRRRARAAPWTGKRSSEGAAPRHEPRDTGRGPLDASLSSADPPRGFWTSVGTPTEVQARAWPVIARGAHVLVSAPTGTGKTLAAFLWGINQLATGALSPGKVRILYVSPLKALNNDIQRNLLSPLAASSSGLPRGGRDAAADPCAHAQRGHARRRAPEDAAPSARRSSSRPRRAST